MKNKKSILITGASSGIGKALALYLDKMGFMVFSGVRTQKDIKKLKEQGSDRLQPILLDVTKIDTIKYAVNIIEKEGEYQFFALINNAGIGLRGVLEVTPIGEVRKLFDTNVIGLYSVTQLFLPLLRKNKGRIINIGSETGLTAVPNGSAYSASKFAVRAISDSLRLELIPFGIFVVYIAPTSTESDIWDKSTVYRNELKKRISSELYEAYKYFFKATEREVVEIIKPIPTIVVVKDIVSAITSLKPQYEYYSGEKAKKAYRMAILPKDRIIRCSIKRLSKFIKMYG